LIKSLVALVFMPLPAQLPAMMLWHQPPETSTQAFGLFYAARNGSYNDRAAGNVPTITTSCLLDHLSMIFSKTGSTADQVRGRLFFWD
jgi:hypothetical protein